MVEPAIPWGALPYARMHFVIMAKASSHADNLVARTRKKSKGVIRKEVLQVWWEGGMLAQQLNRDENLNSLLKEVLLEENEIFIDPTENCIRMYGKWKHEYSIGINKRTLEAYNTIAGHVKKYIAQLAIPTG